ncbi:hypothetical protein T484DRAFT_1928998 [Baffinella frigidus]|nr:hypothetical protein T484DRAFT_1928998 [Cryptophyta sp. CCMP2293]|mmetsp:Transcript_3084/g.7328  ORF Transcript_3084/g.7328 Transcript_3084/m.7328 type:complete len:328 (-) Transcript_3084:106-1089(-)|eukprot:CAMPEP_0180136524 /NCGR_PEP_ID=MMETSP0986-20121125/11563_1 /TAXON_ID=697907 /ORGANISM="non described non described, Strain CCMP2293" /LENGTH=327 /DNA_ID=CAMNT_0022077601 /DNA_START=242 /DNA_END=1225 /DNA_ORIENTATION=+
MAPSKSCPQVTFTSRAVGRDLLLALVVLASARTSVADSGARGAVPPQSGVMRLRGGSSWAFLSPINFGTEPVPVKKSVSRVPSWLSPLSFGAVEEPAPVENVSGLASWLSPLMGAWNDEEESSMVKEEETISSPMKSEEIEAEEKKEAAPSTIASVESSIIIDAPPLDVFTAASSYEDYPRWAGGVSEAKVVSRQMTTSLAREVDFTMGAFGITSQNIMQYEYDAPRRMKWVVTKGSVKELVGEYNFKPLPGGRTEVVYKLKVDPGVPMPRMLRDASSKAVACAALGDLKKWVERAPSLVDASDGALAGAPNEEVHHDAAFREMVPI